jgi:Fic family protein
MRLLDAGDDFVGNLNARKYMGMTKCSKATATRDLIELTERGFIEPTGAGGRSTAYRLKIL